MPLSKLDLTNQRFGRLLVIKESEIRKRKLITWECICDCGNKCLATTQDLRIGDTTSCGCWNIEKPKPLTITHGYSNHPLYKTWVRMIKRCYDENSNDYYLYGARGISVCEEWVNNPKPFCDWGLESGYIQGLSIDRIDNNGNYCPENCRWANVFEQARNKRNNINITIFDSTKCLKQWCNIFQVSYPAAKLWHRKGKNVKEKLLKAFSMKEKHIIIVNGQGFVGKNSVCDITDNYISCGSISTVDKIKKAYSLLGWSGEKNEVHRKALSDIKDIATKTLDHSYRYCKNAITDFLSEECPWKILFIHSREPEEIARLVKDFGCVTLLIKNKNVKLIDSNHADADVENYDYDFIIHNDGTLDDLNVEVQRFLMELYGE